MNQEELKAVLPHRDNMLLIQEAFCENGVARGSVFINGGEWFLKGNFPGNPVVPGVMLCEMLAQSACVLLAGEMRGKARLPLFTGLDKVRFRRSVRPGDTLKTECVLTRAMPPFYFAKGKGFVDGLLCVEASFSFALSEV